MVEKAKTATKPEKTSSKLMGTYNVWKKKAEYDDDAKITVYRKVADNPKKGASAERYSHYRSGMTVAQALKAGILKNDLVWDEIRNYVRVEGSDVPVVIDKSVPTPVKEAVKKATKKQSSPTGESAESQKAA